ncbi:MAG: hypothetical protein AB1716_09120 [Planctomycetota bacterium]
MRVESGPARTDRNWQIVRFVLFFGFTVFFIYDGLVRWPNQNRAAAARALQLRPFEGRGLTVDALAEQPTESDFENMQRAAPRTAEDVHRLLGKPAFTEGTDEYYVSRYGFGRVSVRDGAVSASEQWRKWPDGGRSKAEIQGQFYWAIIPGIFALYFLWKLYKAATLRVTVDDEGLVYAGQRIAFTAMVSLRDYSPKGWIDLYYKAGEREARLRLDREKIALFDDVIDALCQAKGFPNQVREHAAQKRAEAESEPADEAAADRATVGAETPDQDDARPPRD